MNTHKNHLTKVILMNIHIIHMFHGGEVILII